MAVGVGALDVPSHCGVTAKEVQAVSLPPREPVEQKHHSFPWPLRVGAPLKLMQFVDRWVLELLVQPPILLVEEALLKSEPEKENLKTQHEQHMFMGQAVSLQSAPTSNFCHF